LKAKIGGELQDAIAEAYLSEIPGIEDALAEYISIALKSGLALRDRLAERAPLAVEKAARKTRAEAHRFLGLVRFAELADGSLYAAIEPGCAILPLIAEHFSERLPGYVWAIRDLKRDEALFHEAGKGAVLERGLRLEGKPLLSDMEESIRAAWREYFARVSIEERKNPGLQASHMPKKYWKWLPEMEGRAK
jgi:probable DNA metabolism protein